MEKINSALGHLVFFIQDYDKNIEIYRKLFNYLDYKIFTDESFGIGVETPNKLSVWVMEASVTQKNNRDSNGLNHLAFHVKSREEVDQFTEEFLKPNGIECLFDTPRARPDFTGDKNTYYQVMFELPGEVLFEVVYTDYL